ncbi:MAG: type II CAAX endopeptidase family protein [Candidatus Omnitrophota bacterium]|jgi:hypothetical protein
MLKSDKKRNTFILLSLFCLLLIVFIQLSIPVGPVKHQQFKIAFDKDKLFSNQYIFLVEILISVYLIAILSGLFNLINFVIHNLKKPLFEFKKRDESFPLGQEESSQLIFFVMFLALIIYSSQWLILIFKLKVNPLDAIVVSNLAIETGVILIIIKYFKSSYLDFRLNTNRALDAVKKYLTILPVLVGIIFINNFVLEKFGITTSINPAIELFLKIKNIPLLSLLLFQIIFLGPVAEELFFRGFIYKLLRKKYNFLLSAVCSSLLFTMLHRSSHDILPLLILSISLCYIYEKSKNIASPILFHIIHNSLSISFLLLIKTLV